MALIVMSGLASGLQRVKMSQAVATDVAALLVKQGRSFYYEPYPNDVAMIAVDLEHLATVKAAAKAHKESKE